MSENNGVFLSVRDLFLEGQKSFGQDLHFRKSSNFISGDKRSKVRGRGMDFYESRPYVAQDEIKNIDWKVSARLNGLFTKIYTEEKDRPVFIVVDLKSSMFFGSINCFKSVLASSLAARLAIAGLNGGDHVGGLVFNENTEQECSVKAGRKNIARFFTNLSEGLKQNLMPKKASWISVLNRASRQPAGSMVFLISDFFGLDESIKPELFRLRKKADVLAMRIFDPLEKDLPSLGMLSMVYGEQAVVFDSSDRSFRKRFFAQKNREEQSLQQIFKSVGVPMMEFSTGQDPSIGLKKIFSGRW